MFRLRILSAIAATGAIAAVAVVAAIALVAAAAPVRGEAAKRDAAACEERQGSPANCVPLVACLEGTGIYFTGRALGWNRGTFAGRTNTGIACSGRWTARNAFGLGQASIECDDGRRGVAFFAYRDMPTGTAVGRGMMDDGGTLRMWSGHDIRRFVIDSAGRADARLMCDGMPVPLG